MKSPLHFNPGFVRDAEKNDDEAVLKRIINGESANSYDELGRTALVAALENAIQDAESVVPRLLSEGANPNITNQDGQAPLHIAARTGNHDATELLLCYGSEINALDKFGKTPLDLSQGCQHEQVTELLYSEWALTGTEVSNKIALAREEGNTLDGAQGDIHKFPRPNSNFVKDAEDGRTEMLQAHIARGESPDSVNDLGDSALLLAVREKHDDAAILLLESGASPHLADQDHYTPLHEAARLGNLFMVKFLVEHGASVNSLSNDITTPLDLCDEGKNLETSEYLHLHGAEPGLKIFADFVNKRDVQNEYTPNKVRAKTSVDREEFEVEE